ncbi:MAG: nucleotidyltransferase family protein [Chloroflexota bacterium]
MRRDEALRILAEHKEAIAGFGVKSLSLFGSVARDDAGPDSDVDILVEFGRPVGLFGFIDLNDYLEGLLGRRVDLVTPDALKARLRDRILGEAIRAA